MFSGICWDASLMYRVLVLRVGYRQTWPADLGLGAATAVEGFSTAFIAGRDRRPASLLAILLFLWHGRHPLEIICESDEGSFAKQAEAPTCNYYL